MLAQSTPPVRALWAIVDITDIAAARFALGAREGIPESRRAIWVGSWQAGEEHLPDLNKGLDEWARRKEIDGVFWTALPAEFNNEERMPTIDEVVNYLSGLSGHERDRAEEYVRRAPRQVETPYRHRIETVLGWKPV